MTENEDVSTELSIVRPDLTGSYDRALPQARAEILARLLGALDREPLPGAGSATGPAHARDGAGRSFSGSTATAPTASGAPGRSATAERTTRVGDVVFPAAAARPFAAVRAGLTATVAGAALTDPVALVTALGWADGFRDEIANSVANLALAYADRPAAATRTLRPGVDLATVEQLVVDGHPLHPCCRTRTGLGVADVLAYAPEHRPTFRLRKLRVPADQWYGDGPPVLLAHPWQAERLRERHPWLVPDGETGPVRPLMSLRTVDTGAGHVKTAVDIQMTSAVRTVSPAAVHNGPRLSVLLRELTADLPLDVLAETGAGAVLVDGVADRHLAHLRREAPRTAPGQIVLPLAALAAPDPYDGRPLLIHAAAAPYAWWHDFMHLLLPPLLTVLDRGVALEAHGQNTLVVLDRELRPVRILYRDFGGVRVSARRLAAAGVQVPPLAGDLPSDDPAVLRTKLAAAVLGTVTGQLVAVLERGGADPAKLWAVTAQAVAAAGTSDGARMLTDPLPLKATTAMRLATDPLDDVWVHLDNPMAAL
ncbi:IucA/IucC family protein [Actinoplanes sp. NPDC051494]|uniref:IucA/IucC family protein n=1 Tax=Actinoplanes sp. NPDC051494 TaxID=3363907 RepID=UPI00378D460E